MKSPIATTARMIARVEEPAVPVRPHLEVAAPLAPEEEEEERDREEKRDREQTTDGCDHGLKLEHDDDDRDQRDDPDAAGERRDPVPEAAS